MTSRERVLKALNHQQPDRVPIDLSACRASGIAATVYDQLRRRMGLQGPIKLFDKLQLLAEVEMPVLEKLHVDAIALEPPAARWGAMKAEQGIRRRLFSGLEVYFPPDANIRVDADGSWLMCTAAGEPYARMPKDGYYFDYMRKTMGGRGIAPSAFRPSATVPDEELKMFGERARFLYEHTDKALVGWGASISMMGMSWLLSDNITQGSLDDWLMMLMTEKETAHEMMGRYVDATIAKMKLYHQAIGERCVMWGVASDDGGTQRGPLLRPELFAEMIIPHYRRVCDWVHQNTKWKTFLHSCGSVYEYLPHWIAAGIDVFNPVQISAANMEPERLKREFGDRLVFWGGGCDTQRVLPKGTPAEVREHVRRNIEVFAPGGGFVFCQVHNIQQNVPVENVEAMFQAAYDYGKSPR